MRASWMVFLTLAACGSVKGAAPDGPAGGGQDAASGPVLIDVLTDTGDGNPDLGASVLVMADDGTVVFDGLVDANGKVSAELHGAGSITVRSVDEPSATTRNVRMTTVRGAHPGEHYMFGRPRTPGMPSGAVTQRSFTYAPFSGTASHTMYTACGNRFIAAGGATSGTLPIYEGCAPETFDFLAVAEVGTQQSFVYLPGQQRSATTTINVPLPWTAMSDLTATYANVPAGMDYFATIRHTLLNGVVVLDAGDNVPNPGAGGAFTQHLPYAPGVGSGARFEVTFGNQTTTGERQRVTISTASPTATIGFDFANQTLPRLIQIPALTTEGASWAETAVAHASDARLVVWRGGFTGAVTTQIEWKVIDGERASTFVLPTLPASYAMYDPRKLSGFTQLEGAFAYYVDCDMLAGYAAARPLQLALFERTAELQDALGPNYRCRVSESPYSYR